MTSIPANPDVVIIGAGAAGIGAGLALTRLGVPFVILEAKDRVGGRAYSESHSVGALWDHGCHWFHSAEINPLRGLADKLGHAYRPRSVPWSVGAVIDGQRLSDAEHAELGERFDGAFERLAAVAAAGGPDRPVAEVIDLSPPFGVFVRRIFEAITAGPPEEVSLIDNGRYAGTEEDFAVIAGYGALMVRLANGLPVRLSTPVRSVTTAGHGAQPVQVTTDAGTLRAGAAIVTVSTNVLRSGAIRFEPRRSAGVSAALEDVICGDCEKIALEILEEAGADPFGGFADAGLHIACDGQALGVQVRPFGRPIVTSYLAGSLARDMAGAGDAEAGGYLTERLVDAFGSSVRKAVGRAKVTRWSRDPHVQGAYSYVNAGRARSRETLIEADTAPLYLAGEAMLLDHYSTAHGAYLSGLRTAHKVAAALGCGSGEPDPLWVPE